MDKVCHTIDDLLVTVVNRTKMLIKDTDNECEKAFLLGMFHLANSVVQCPPEQKVKICLDYNTVKKAFDYANKTLPNQISIADLHPEIFKVLESYVKAQIKKHCKYNCKKQDKE